jgi:hypothetical protein
MRSQYKHQETQIMIFSKNKKASTNNEPALNFTFKNSLLEKVNEYLYTKGLIFNSNGKASQNLAQENRKAYSGLRSKIQFGNNLSVKDWLNLYDSIISPIMTYIVWIRNMDIWFQYQTR